MFDSAEAAQEVLETDDPTSQKDSQTIGKLFGMVNFRHGRSLVTRFTILCRSLIAKPK